MNRRVRSFALALTGICFVAAVNGCALFGKKETHVSVADMSAAARTTTERVTAGGTVTQVTREKERGRIVYDVEATIQGKHQEFLISDSDGEVLGTETSIEFSECPKPVREAAVKYFGSPYRLRAMKGIEYGEISYEIEGAKKGKTVEITFDELGRER
jgi:hypothetical protein